MATTTPNIITAFLEEPWYYLMGGFVLAFLFQTVSAALAGVYFILLAVDAFAYLSLKPVLNFNSVSGNTKQAIVYAVVAFAAFIAISVFTINFFQASANLTLSSVMDRIGGATFGATTKPILENNPIAIFIIGAVLIPIIETKSLIARLMEILSRIFKLTLDLKSPSTWVMFLIVSGIGVAFHFQAKGITDNIALALTFIFWLVSCFLIVKTRESESAVYVHGLNNGVTLSRMLG